MIINQKIFIKFNDGSNYNPNKLINLKDNPYTSDNKLVEFNYEKYIVDNKFIKMKDLYKFLELNNDIGDNVLLKYYLPKCQVIKVYNEDKELIYGEDYEAHEDHIRFLKPSELESYFYVDFQSDKDRFVGYKDEGVYKYFDDKDALKPNSVYEVEIKLNDDSVYKETLTTKFDPMYCKKSDVKSLINPVVKDMELEDNDLDFEIFNQSEEVKDSIKEHLGDDFDMKEKGSIVKRLTANKTSLNLMYNYYYKLVGEYGLEEKRVGTLGAQKQRNLAKLDDLIKRFQRNVDALEEQLFGVKITKPFVKAKEHPYPIKGRLWGKK